MARPLQNGLLYFPFDVDFFSDKKIRVLKGRYGSDGVMVYVYLLCEIYKNGYYIILDEDMILCISDDLSLSEASTRQIISFLLSRSLLCEIKDSTLAKSDTVLTAISIQRRYQEAKKGGKRDIAVEAKYWLLEKSETLSFIKVRSEKGISENNSNNSGKNGNRSEKNHTKKSKVKESKVNESKVEESDPPTRLRYLSEGQYSKLCEMSSSSSVERYIDKIIDWQQRSGRVCKDPFGNIKSWIEKDGNKAEYLKGSKPPQNYDDKKTSFDLDDYEDFAMHFDLSKVLNREG